MKKLILLVALVAGVFTVSATSEAKAQCGPRFGGYYSGYNYAPTYAYPSYYSPGYTYQYGPVNSFGYSYPSTGFYYGSPGLSVSIGSAYRGYNYGSYGYGGYGGYGGYSHHHRRW